MTGRNRGCLLLAALLLGPLAAAQDGEGERQREHAQLERERAERERAEVERQRAEIEREVVDIEIEMREAEARLAEAAQRVAELSTRRLPRLAGGYWSGALSGRAVLGITIPAAEDSGPVEGVEVLGVSPGGPADEAGLRAGDVITAVNDESLSADTVEAANQRLLEFMEAVEEGDVIDVEYLRSGKSLTVEIAPRSMSAHAFSFGGPDTDFHFSVPAAPGAPRPEINRYVFVTGDHGWGDLEMVKLTEDLGRYFGTDDGMLVVRAPEDESFKLRDGDVILDIDGRKPTSVSHAIRILGSYQAGETLKIRIMRDQRPQTLEIEVPDSRTGAVRYPAPPAESKVTIGPRIERKLRIRSAEERT